MHLMKLTKKEEELLLRYMDGIKEHEEVLRMKTFIQHGDTSTYDHCVEVTRLAFLLSRRLPWFFHEKSMADCKIKRNKLKKIEP